MARRATDIDRKFPTKLRCDKQAARNKLELNERRSCRSGLLVPPNQSALFNRASYVVLLGSMIMEFPYRLCR